VERGQPVHDWPGLSQPPFSAVGYERGEIQFGWKLLHSGDGHGRERSELGGMDRNH
jgi:hypothetical protein